MCPSINSHLKQVLVTRALWPCSELGTVWSFASLSQHAAWLVSLSTCEICEVCNRVHMLVYACMSLGSGQHVLYTCPKCTPHCVLVCVRKRIDRFAGARVYECVSVVSLDIPAEGLNVSFTQQQYLLCVCSHKAVWCLHFSDVCSQNHLAKIHRFCQVPAWSPRSSLQNLPANDSTTALFIPSCLTAHPD